MGHFVNNLDGGCSSRGGVLGIISKSVGRLLLVDGWSICLIASIIIWACRLIGGNVLWSSSMRSLRYTSTLRTLRVGYKKIVYLSEATMYPSGSIKRWCSLTSNSQPWKMRTSPLECADMPDNSAISSAILGARIKLYFWFRYLLRASRGKKLTGRAAICKKRINSSYAQRFASSITWSGSGILRLPRRLSSWRPTSSRPRP